MGSGASSDAKELQRIFDACDLESCGSLTGEDLKIAFAGVGLAKDAAKTVDFPAFCELVKEAMVSSPDPPRIVPFALRGMRFEQLQAICEVCGCGQDGWLLAQCQSAMESESGTRRLKEDLYSLNRFLVRPATAGPEDVQQCRGPIMETPAGPVRVGPCHDHLAPSSAAAEAELLLR